MASPKDEGKPSEMDSQRSIPHLADSVAWNLSHAERHMTEAKDHAAKLIKHIKKHGILRQEAIKLAASRRNTLP